MPITYERADSRRLITVTVTEPYTVEELFGVIDRRATVEVLLTAAQRDDWLARNAHVRKM